MVMMYNDANTEPSEDRKRLIAQARKNFDRYAARGESLASVRVEMDGSDVKIKDDPLKYPLAYGNTHHGELRRFAEKMTEVHKGEGIIKVVELIDDVNYGLPNEQAALIALYKAAKSGRHVYFNLNFLEDIQGILSDTRKYPRSIAEMELRHIYERWNIFQHVVSFYKNDKKVKPPWKS
jgi:hypothetical protein